MKKEQIHQGHYYICKINGRTTIVRVDDIGQAYNNRRIYKIKNVITGRETRAYAAKKFRRLALPADAEVLCRGKMSPNWIMGLQEKIRSAHGVIDRPPATQSEAVAVTNPPSTEAEFARATVDQTYTAIDEWTCPEGTNPLYWAMLRRNFEVFVALPDSAFKRRWLQRLARERDNRRTFKEGDWVEYDDEGHGYHRRVGYVRSIIEMGGGAHNWATIQTSDSIIGGPFWSLKLHTKSTETGHGDNPA